MCCYGFRKFAEILLILACRAMFGNDRLAAPWVLFMPMLRESHTSNGPCQDDTVKEPDSVKE